MGGSDGDISCKLALAELDIDWLFLLYFVGGLIVISVILEFFYHWLELKLLHHEHYLRILRRVFKELVILGTLAFLLLVVREVSNLTHEQFQLVEFAHIWIFLVGFVFVLQAMLIMSLTGRVKDRWDRAFIQGPKLLLDEYYEKQDHISWRPKFIRYIFGKDKILENMELMVFKHFFIRTCGLPLSFDFSKYLRRFLSIHISEDIDIGWMSWALMILIFGVGIAGIEIANVEGHHVPPEVILWVAFAVTVINFCFGLAIIVLLERGRDILLEKSGCPDLRDLPEKVTELVLPRSSEFDFVIHVMKSNTDGDLEIPKRENSSLHVIPENEDDSKVLIRHTTSERKRDSTHGHQRDHIHHRHKKKILIVDELLKEANKTGEHLLDVYPCHKPFALLFGFEFVLLLQCFTVGLLFLDLFQIGRTPTTISISVISFILHFAMALFIVPKVVRNWGLLEAICLINNDSLSIVEDVLKVQEEVHIVTRRFAIALYDAFLETLEEIKLENADVHNFGDIHGPAEHLPGGEEKGATTENILDIKMDDQQDGSQQKSMDQRSSKREMSRSFASMSVDSNSSGIPLEQYASQVERYLKTSQNSTFPDTDELGKELSNTEILQTFARLFHKLDRENNKVVAAHILPSRLSHNPFRFHITGKECRQLLRALGCKNGFTLVQFIHIIHVSFHYISIEEEGEKIEEKVLDCFGEVETLKCKHCGNEIELLSLPEHAAKCGRSTPNYSLELVSKAVSYIKDNHAQQDRALLQPLPWTTRPRRISFDSNVESLRRLSILEEEDLPSNLTEQ